MNWNTLRKISNLYKPELDSSNQNDSETLQHLIAEFDSAENITKSLYLSAKKLPDHILCTAKFEKKLTDDLTTSRVFDDQEFMVALIEEWSSFAKVSSNIADEYVVSLQKSLFEPLKHLKIAFAELRAAIKLHDAIHSDVFKFQRRLASLNDKEKTGTNLVKIQEAKQNLADCRKEFSKQTQSLLNALSKFLEGSLEMLQPLLEGFIAAEIAWVKACKKSIDNKSHLSTAFLISSQSECVRSIENSFKELNALSICSESK